MEQTPRPPHQPAGIPPSMRRPGGPSHPAPPKPTPRPSLQQIPPPQLPPKVSHTQKPPESKKSLTFATVAIGIVATIIIIATIIIGVTKLVAAGEVKTGSDRYQAVFLTNNMVYFGRISNITGEYIKMTDVFYLQMQSEGEQKNQQQPRMSLAKLGNELHGPEDAMFINRNEVLFWENLKPDGKVVQAIKNFQSGNK